MSSEKVKTNIRGNSIAVTMECATIGSLLTFIDKIKLKGVTIPLNNTPSYLPYIISSSLVNCISGAIPDLAERKRIQYTNCLSLGISIISSCAVSTGYNGVSYFIRFSIQMIKCSVATTIINKLNKLKIIDGLSLFIVISCLMGIPSMIGGICTKGAVSVFACVFSLGILFISNYTLLKNTEDIEAHHQKGKETFGINCRNTLTTSLITSSLISRFIPYIPESISIIIITPLVHYLISKIGMNPEQINDQLQKNGIYINKLKHGKETKKTIDTMIFKNTFKMGLIGGLLFTICSIIIELFTVNISAITLTIFINSLMDITFGIRSTLRMKQTESNLIF